MNEEIKKRLDKLFVEIEKLKKEADLFHIAGSKSDFTKDVEDLRGMHESVTKDYHKLHGDKNHEQAKKNLLETSDHMEQRIRLVKKSFEERKK